MDKNTHALTHRRFADLKGLSLSQDGKRKNIKQRSCSQDEKKEEIIPEIEKNQAEVKDEQKVKNLSVLSTQKTQNKRALEGILKNTKAKAEGLPFYEEQNLQRRQQFQVKMNKKKNTYSKFLEQLDQRRNTFSKFCFKSYEKDENPFINPLMQKMNQTDVKGSMYVIDLWEDRALKQCLSYSKLKDGKYMMRRIAQQINQEQKQLKKDQPTIFTTKDETILKGKLQDKDQLNHFMKHINDDFSNSEMLIDRKMNKNDLSSIKNPINSSLNQQNLQNKSYLQEQQDLTDPTQPFDGIKFIKHFFSSAERNSPSSPDDNFNQFAPSPTSLVTSPLGIPKISSPLTLKRQTSVSYSTNPYLFERKNSCINKFSIQPDLSALKQLNKKSNFFSSPMTQSVTAASKQESLYSSPKISVYSSNNLLDINGKNKSISFSNQGSKQFVPLSSDKEGGSQQEIHLSNKLNVEIMRKSGEFKSMNKIDGLTKQKKLTNQKSQEDIIINEHPAGSMTSSRLSNLIGKKKQCSHIEKINSMLKEMDSLQQIDINSKKHIDDLIDRIQDQVIIQEENERKRYMDIGLEINLI